MGVRCAGAEGEQARFARGTGEDRTYNAPHDPGLDTTCAPRMVNQMWTSYIFYLYYAPLVDITQSP